MVSLETNKKKIDLINHTTPLSNLFNHDRELREKYFNQYQDFVSWTHNYPSIDINKLSSKTKAFSSLMGKKSLAVKVLGSGSYKNHIWIINVDSRPYVVYLSLRGLSMETLPTVTPQEVLKDLKTIQKHFKIKPCPWKV